uniref:Uncharacterized protein n=1 Tax=Aegilops tauschii subsp. strangulata TaxID=200361 RepID=A0A453G6X1_AEGTS
GGRLADRSTGDERRAGAESAAGLPVPPDGRGAGDTLPLPPLRRRAHRRPHHHRDRPLQVRPLAAPEDGAVRREGVVLLLPAGPQVPQRVQAQPGRRVRLLEGHRGRQARGHPQAAGHQEGARLLRWQGPQGREDQLDHARVPPRRRRPLRPQEEQPQGKQTIPMHDRRRPWIWAAGFRGGWARGAAPRCHLLNDSRCVNA